MAVSEAADDTFRQLARLPQLEERDPAVPLRKPRAILAQEQRNVRERGRRRLERGVKEKLADRRGQQVSSPNDLADLHRDVVDDHRELVGGDSVRAPHDEVPERSRLRFVAAGDPVGEREDTDRLGTEPPRMSGPRCDPPRDLARFQVSAGPGVERFVSRCLGRARGGLDVLAAAKTRIDQPRVAKAREGRVVAGSPLALCVGRVRAAGVRPFVPIQPEPA